MKKKSLIFLSVIALSAVMVIAFAATYMTLTFTNMTANVSESGTLTITIGSTTYHDGDSLTYSWGTVAPGSTDRQVITITSNVNTAVTPSLQASGLPTGWTLTLNDTSSIPAFGTSARELVLTVPSNALAGPSSSWSATLTVASS